MGIRTESLKSWLGQQSELRCVARVWWPEQSLCGWLTRKMTSGWAPGTAGQRHGFSQT